MTTFELKASGSVNGQRIVITGGTSGIGYEAARALSVAGAEVVLVSRSASRTAAAAETISAASGHAVETCVADFASLDHVRAAGQELRERFSRIDVLVNNAGAIYPDRRTTADGFEMTWQVDHLAPFLLTNLLRPALEASGHSQVITVSSDAHLAAWRGLRFDDLNGERSWSPFGAYAAAKLANIMFSAELARRWRPSIRSNALHPGVVQTSFGRGAEWHANRRWAVTDLWALSAAQGADTLVYLASSPDVADMSGAYLYKRRPKKPSRVARDVSSQERLWEISAAALGMGSA